MDSANGWSKCKLGEVIEVASGYAFKSADYLESGIPIIRISDIQNGKIDVGKSVRINQKIDFEPFTIKKGEVLIAMSGATTGKIGIYNSSEKAYQNQRVGKLRPRPKSGISNALIYYLLLFLKQKIVTISYGGAQPNISSKKIEGLPINLPPLPEQRMIVDKIEALFSQLDNAVANIMTAMRKLKVYRQAVLQQAFTGELTKKWREEHPDLPTGAELLETIKVEREERYQNQLRDWKQAVKAWEEAGKKGKKPTRPKKPVEVTPLSKEELEALPELPGGWLWTSLGSVCSKIFDGTHFSPQNFPSGKYKYITAKNIKDGRLVLDNITYVSEKDHNEIYSRCDVKKGDVLYIKDGATTGRACVNVLDEEFSLLSSVGVFRTNPSFIIPKFLEIYLNSEMTRQRMLKNTAGVAITRLTLVKLNKAEIVLVPYLEQQQIVGEVERRMSVCDRVEGELEAALNRSGALRRSILKRAFEGRLLNERELEEARRAPDWEPAEELLRRVGAE